MDTLKARKRGGNNSGTDEGKQTGQTSKVLKRERIIRILQKVCSAELIGLIHIKESKSLKIRSSFKTVAIEEGKERLILSKISLQGLQKLKVGEIIQLEVLGMANRVLFTTKILSKWDTGISVSIPSKIVRIERRKNSRYRTNNENMAYMTFSNWLVKEGDIASPPMFPLFENVANWCPVFDMSMGGACVLISFPSILSSFDISEIDVNAKLILPMTEPITVPTQFCWQKRTINKRVVNKSELKQLQFRFGVMWSDLDEDTLLKIRFFLRQLSMAEAI